MAGKEESEGDKVYDPEDDGQPHNTTKRYNRAYDGPPPPLPKRANVDVHDPLFFWLILLMAAVVLRILLTTTSYIPSGTQVYQVAVTYSNFLLEFPGIMILPIVVGAVIGSEVGERSNSLASALKSGLINGIYASIIYLIAIVIIYIVLTYSTPQFTTVYNTVFNDIVIPIMALLVVLEIFATLSYSRKVDA